MSSLFNGIVGCWSPSAVGSGLLLPDLSGYGNHGSLTGMDASSWQSSTVGRSLYYDGSNDSVIGNINSINADGSFSLMGWAKLDANTNYRTIISIGNASLGFIGAIYVYLGGILRFELYNGSDNPGLNSVNLVDVGKWYFVCAVRGPNYYKVFLNGREENSAALSVNLPAATIYTLGNSRNYTDRLIGQIGETAVYNRVLTEVEVNKLYQNGNGWLGKQLSNKRARKYKYATFINRTPYKPPKPYNYSIIRVKDSPAATLRQGLVGAWCPSLAGSGNVVPDLSGYNSHGTLTNMGPEKWVTEGQGRVLDFDGTDDYINVDNGPAVTSEYTLSAWINLRAVRNYNVLLYRGSTGDIEVYSATATQLITVAHNRGNGGSFSYTANHVGTGSVNGGWGTFVIGRLSHWALTYRNNTWRMYKDGVRAGNAVAGISDPLLTSANWRIGSTANTSTFGNDNEWNGTIDDVRIYKRALTDVEILSLSSERGIGLDYYRKVIPYQFPDRRRNHALIGNMF